MAEGLFVRDGGTWKPVTLSVRSGGVWRPVLEAFVRESGVWKRFYQSLTASAAPGFISGFRLGSGSVTSDAATATPSGGIGPFTYAWEIVSQIGGTASLTSASTASTEMTATLTAPQTITGEIRCVVTDTVTGQTANTNNVSFLLDAQV
jgi:hypothetical protein